jgi:hypothetical protein
LAIATGIIVGDVLVALYVTKPMHDLNIGAVCLLINVAIMIGGSLLAGRRQVMPVALRGAAVVPQRAIRSNRSCPGAGRTGAET